MWLLSLHYESKASSRLSSIQIWGSWDEATLGYNRNRSGDWPCSAALYPP